MGMEEQREARLGESDDATSPPSTFGVFPFGTGAFQFWVYFATLGIPLVAEILLFLYCKSVSRNVMQAFVPSIMVAWAATAAGALLGFLFGIPRAQPTDSSLPGRREYGRRRLLINTNLEQVSDWLTKIIVGVTLVELGKVLPALGRLVDAVASIYGGNAPGATVIAAAVVIVFSVLGFFYGYIGTRSLLTVVFETVAGS